MGWGRGDGSKEDTEDAEFDLTRGIRISVSEIFVCSVVNCCMEAHLADLIPCTLI